MGPITDHRNVLDRVKRSIGQDGRERALFWYFGHFDIGDHEPQALVVAKLALAEVVGDEIELIEDEFLEHFTSYCGKLFLVYFKPSLKASKPLKRLPNPRKLSTLSDIPKQLWSVVAMQLDSTGRWKLVPKNRVGRIITDGVDLAIAKLPIKTCEFCGEIFAPSRVDSKYCRSACRSSAGTNRHRAAKKGETDG